MSGQRAEQKCSYTPPIVADWRFIVHTLFGVLWFIVFGGLAKMGNTKKMGLGGHFFLGISLFIFVELFFYFFFCFFFFFFYFFYFYLVGNLDLSVTDAHTVAVVVVVAAACKIFFLGDSVGEVFRLSAWSM